MKRLLFSKHIREAEGNLTIASVLAENHDDYLFDVHGWELTIHWLKKKLGRD